MSSTSSAQSGAPLSSIQARLEARKYESGKTSEEMRVELEERMNRAASNHEALMKERMDACAAEVTRAKEIASKVDKSNLEGNE